MLCSHFDTAAHKNSTRKCRPFFSAGFWGKIFYHCEIQKNHFSEFLPGVSRMSGHEQFEISIDTLSGKLFRCPHMRDVTADSEPQATTTCSKAGVTGVPTPKVPAPSEVTVDVAMNSTVCSRQWRCCSQAPHPIFP